MDAGVQITSATADRSPISRLSTLRVALVHDWLTGMRGGEKCLEVLCRAFPDATLHTLIHRRGELRAEKIAQQRLAAHPKIEVLYNTVVEEILGTMRTSHDQMIAALTKGL